MMERSEHHPPVEGMRNGGHSGQRQRGAPGHATGGGRYALQEKGADERSPRLVRFQRMTIVNGILAFVIIMVILQLWLLTATMNAYLGGETSILLPAALASLACLALNAGLLWYLYRLER